MYEKPHAANPLVRLTVKLAERGTEAKRNFGPKLIFIYLSVCQ